MLFCQLLFFTYSYILSIFSLSTSKQFLLNLLYDYTIVYLTIEGHLGTCYCLALINKCLYTDLDNCQLSTKESSGDRGWKYTKIYFIQGS